jgi:hypothetical protein
MICPNPSVSSQTKINNKLNVGEIKNSFPIHKLGSLGQPWQ